MNKKKELTCSSLALSLITLTDITMKLLLLLLLLLLLQYKRFHITGYESPEEE